MSVHRRIVSQLKMVPNSNHVTEIVCDKFSGYLQVDAKYVSVKGHDKKMAFIWAIDYYTHDIVWQMLVPSENSYAYLTIFKRLKSAGYQLKGLTCDEHPAILTTVNQVFPRALVQVCTTHYKRNIRKQLDTRNVERDRRFFSGIKELFAAKDMKKFGVIARQMLKEYDEKKYREILVDIHLKEAYLTSSIRYQRVPNTTNLIEGYNKHLGTRIRKLDGFKSYTSAERWLNAYVMLKRTNRLRTCKGQFKKLNGHSPISLTARDDIEGISMLKRG